MPSCPLAIEAPLGFGSLISRTKCYDAKRVVGLGAAAVEGVAVDLDGAVLAHHGADRTRERFSWPTGSAPWKAGCRSSRRDSAWSSHAGIVADDVLLTRQGIVRLLRDADIEVVAEAEDTEGLLHHVRLARPDVALVDIRMPPTHTDEGLALSRYVEPSYAMRLLQEEPERVGYLLKERVFDIATVVGRPATDRERGDGDRPTIVSRLVGRRRRAGPMAVLASRSERPSG